MAAGQQKRAAGVVKYNLQEQCGGKKKKIVDGNALNMRPHISLEWDDCQKKVMAKREQIGISWRDISPSIDSAHPFKTGLAVVFPVPEEIFTLENLMSVLTYKVWKTHLSESERSLLSQFLPRGTDDVDQVVQTLLMGENLHFGNPSFSWGASLCSGNLHPDVLIHWDHRFKARKKAYYSGLQKYHFDMVDNLQKWKSRLACCNNLEGEIVGKMCRKYKLGSSTFASEATAEVANSGQEMLEKAYIRFGDAAKYGTYSKIVRAYFGGREISDDDLETALLVGMSPQERRRFHKKRGLSVKPFMGGIISKKALENNSDIASTSPVATSDGASKNADDLSIPNCRVAEDKNILLERDDTARDSSTCCREEDNLLTNGDENAEAISDHVDGILDPDSDNYLIKKPGDATSNSSISMCHGTVSSKYAQKLSLLGHGPHGKLVVEQLLKEHGDDGIRQFCQRWRQIFVEAIHPRFLPAGWDIKHSGRRDFGEYSVYNPAKRQQKDD